MQGKRKLPKHVSRKREIKKPSGGHGWSMRSKVIAFVGALAAIAALGAGARKYQDFRQHFKETLVENDQPIHEWYEDGRESELQLARLLKAQQKAGYSFTQCAALYQGRQRGSDKIVTGSGMDEDQGIHFMTSEPKKWDGEQPRPRFDKDHILVLLWCLIGGQFTMNEYNHIFGIREKAEPNPREDTTPADDEHRRRICQTSEKEAKFDDARETLGADHNASYDEIKKEYKREMRENHPDRLPDPEDDGISDEERRDREEARLKGKEKFARHKAAFELLKEETPTYGRHPALRINKFHINDMLAAKGVPSMKEEWEKHEDLYRAVGSPYFNTLALDLPLLQTEEMRKLQHEIDEEQGRLEAIPREDRVARISAHEALEQKKQELRMKEDEARARAQREAKDWVARPAKGKWGGPGRSVDVDVLPVGTRIVILGQEQELNGTYGTITGWNKDTEEYRVLLQDSDRIVFMTASEVRKLQPHHQSADGRLPMGSKVIIEGLQEIPEAGARMWISGIVSRPELNGNVALCIRPDPDKEGRWIVRLNEGTELKLKEGVLKTLNGSHGIIVAHVRDSYTVRLSGGTTIVVARDDLRLVRGDHLLREGNLNDGDYVRISGLTEHPNLNGAHGIILSYDEQSNRYIVYVYSKHVKPHDEYKNVHTFSLLGVNLHPVLLDPEEDEQILRQEIWEREERLRNKFLSAKVEARSHAAMLVS